MYVGGSVFLIALGAVIRFAVADNVVEGVDLDIRRLGCMAGPSVICVPKPF
jgi:hypothetical protein